MNPHFGLTNLPTTLFRYLRMPFERMNRHFGLTNAHSLLEENARLRELLVQLSDLIRRNVVHAR